MGKVIVSREREIEWQAPAKYAASRGEAALHFKRLSAKASGGPNVQIAQYGPGHTEQAHSHPHDEMLYILEGGGTLSSHSLEPGAMLFIERNTVYGPVVGGPKGLKFLRVQLSE